MYANRLGIVAVGRVAENWDGLTYKEPLVYVEPYPDLEYRIKINWLNDFRSYPITPNRIINYLGSNPRRSLQQIRKDDDTVEALLRTNIIKK
jgi:hypothetical protein